MRPLETIRATREVIEHIMGDVEGVLTSARNSRDRAIVAAYAAGSSTAQIAVEAGMSRQRVYAILRRDRDKVKREKDRLRTGAILLERARKRRMPPLPHDVRQQVEDKVRPLLAVAERPATTVEVEAMRSTLRDVIAILQEYQ